MKMPNEPNDGEPLLNHFNYRSDGELWAEDVSLSSLALKYGTPVYVYSRATLTKHWLAFNDAFASHKHLICYAVKANSNLAILNVLAKLGSGFDIVSLGELERVIAAGGDPKKIVFSGVGKTKQEMERALALGIKCFNVESVPELERLNLVAEQMGKIAPISIRVNPNVDAKTHPYIATGLKENKFGIAFEKAFDVFCYANSLANLNVIGVDCHIGSQLTEIEPFIEATQLLLELINKLKAQNIKITHFDIGGGLGVIYSEENPPNPFDYAKALLSVLSEHTDLEIILEPGRAIAANAGILLTQLEYIKHTEDKNFAIVDAAMNDLIRPALYQAWQEIIPVKVREDEKQVYDIVGPVCETGDYLGKDRALAIQNGDLLAVRSSGAYGFVMSSNYNTRARAAEVMVDGDKSHLIRQREPLDSLWQLERILPE